MAGEGVDVAVDVNDPDPGFDNPGALFAGLHFPVALASHETVLTHQACLAGQIDNAGGCPGSVGLADMSRGFPISGAVQLIEAWIWVVHINSHINTLPSQVFRHSTHGVESQNGPWFI